MIWAETLPFFARAELACRHCGTIRMDHRFAAALPYLRLTWGRPLKLTSVCRCPAHNVASKGHPTSMHLTVNPKYPDLSGTAAADIYWEDWNPADQEKFYNHAWSLGWACGLHDTFLHVDRRSIVGKPQLTFLYGEWNGTFKTH